MPYIYLGENILYNIGDNLDSTVLYYKLISNKIDYFSFSNRNFIDSFNGSSVPRNALPSSLNLTSIIFYIFNTNVAYTISRALVTIIALIGMYLFLTNYVLNNNKIISVIIGLAFAILPHKPIFGGAVFAIAPLLFFAFFNLYNKKMMKTSFVILFFGPFFSSIIMSTSFIWATLLLVYIVKSISDKEFYYIPVVGLIFLFLGMAISEIHLILINYFAEDFTVHRINRLIGSLDLMKIISISWKLFINEKTSL